MTPLWQSVAEPATEAAAQILLGLLQSESIPARLQSNTPVPGLGISHRIEVPAEFEAQARALLNDAPVSDEELAALALSTKPADSD